MSTRFTSNLNSLSQLMSTRFTSNLNSSSSCSNFSKLLMSSGDFTLGWIGGVMVPSTSFSQAKFENHMCSLSNLAPPLRTPRRLVGRGFKRRVIMSLEVGDKYLGNLNLHEMILR